MSELRPAGTGAVSVFAAALQAYRASRQVEQATEAGLAALQAGRGPLAALDAFTQETGTAMDDTAAAELRQGVQTAIAWLTYVSVGAAFLVETVTDPKMATALEEITRQVMDAGLWAGSWKATLKSWLEEA